MIRKPTTTALYSADKFSVDLHRYGTNEMAEVFTADERAALERGEVVRRSKHGQESRWVSATALALKALEI